MAKIFCKFFLYLPQKNDKTALRKTVLLLKGYVCLLFEQRFDDAHLQSTQLGQSTHTTYATIARVALFVQVVNHTVTVVGAHRDGALLLLLQLTMLN